MREIQFHSSYKGKPAGGVKLPLPPPRSGLNEVADLQRLTLSKKRLRRRCFLMIFLEVSQSTFL